MGHEAENMERIESRIEVLSIIGEVEGHETLGERTKTTKYEQILPKLAMIEQNDNVQGP